jgi:Tfp pilus assembly protein PilN
MLMSPLYLIATTLETANIDLVQQIETIDNRLNSPPPPNPTLEALRTRYDRMQDDAEALTTRNEQLAASYFNWATIMRSLQDFDPAQMQLLAFTQTDTTLSITGRASDELLVTAYVDRLRASENFRSVTIQSITLRTERTAGAEAGEQKYTEFTISVEIKIGQSINGS